MGDAPFSRLPAWVVHKMGKLNICPGTLGCIQPTLRLLIRHLGKVVLAFMWAFSTTVCVSFRVLTVYTSINTVYSELTSICLSMTKSSQAFPNIYRWKETCWISTFCFPAVDYCVLFGMAIDQQDKYVKLSMAAKDGCGPHFNKVWAPSMLHCMRGVFVTRVQMVHKCSLKLCIWFLWDKEMKRACSAVPWVSNVVMRKQNSAANRGFLTFLTPPGYSQLGKGRKAVA